MNQIIALHHDKTLVKAAFIKKEGKKNIIESLSTFNSDDVKPFDISKFPPSTTLKTAVSASEILLREITLNLPHRRAIQKALPFQVESLLPYPVDEALIFPVFSKTPEKTTLITLYALKKEHLKSHLEQMAEKSIIPTHVSCVPSALFQYALWATPQASSLVLLHIGEEKSTYIAIQSNRLIVSQSFSLGSHNAHNELQRIATYLSQKLQNVPLLITGDYSSDLKVLIEQAFSPHFLFQESEHPSYAIPLGLALEKEEVQFLQGPFESSLQKRQTQKITRFCLIAALSLSFILGIGGYFAVEKRKTSLLDLIPDATTQNLEEALFTWEKKLKEQKKPSPYTLTVPLVSDLLAWLSTHPTLEGIDIQNLSYYLSRFPSLGKETESYEAKVELTFKAATPRHARIFHDQLLAQDSLAHSKHPISWVTHDDHYITSFVLKAKGKEG